jgi:hypothetical protein
VERNADFLGDYLVAAAARLQESRGHRRFRFAVSQAKGFERGAELMKSSYDVCAVPAGHRSATCDAFYRPEPVVFGTTAKEVWGSWSKNDLCQPEYFPIGVDR